MECFYEWLEHGQVVNACQVLLYMSKWQAPHFEMDNFDDLIVLLNATLERHDYAF